MPASGATGTPARSSAGLGDTSVRLNSVRAFSDVRFPSAKGVLIEVLPPIDNGGAPIPVSFADGHSSGHTFDSMLPGSRNNVPWSPAPVLSTVDGVNGRDIGGGE